MKTTITKEFKWDCAHRLFNPLLTLEENKKVYGLCSNIHGHTYKLFVTISSEDEYLENGMVVNFNILKMIIENEIIRYQDHCLNLTKGDPLIEALKCSDIKINVVKYETTCEMQLRDFWSIIGPKLESQDLILEELTLYETPTSYATLKK